MTDQALWLEHLPLVRFTLNRMKATGELHQTLDDDLLQEGYLAVGQALRTHDASRGKVSTWVCAQVRYAALSYLNKVNAGGVASSQYQAQMTGLPPDEIEGDEAEDDEVSRRSEGLENPAGLVYAEPPKGYADPGEIAEGLTLLRQLRFALDLLSAEDYALLSAVYGLDGEPVSLEDYAQQHGLGGRATALMRRKAAVKRLARLMGEVK